MNILLRVAEGLVVGLVSGFAVWWLLEVAKPDVSACSGTWEYRQDDAIASDLEPSSTGILKIIGGEAKGSQASVFFCDLKGNPNLSIKSIEECPADFLLLGSIDLERASAEFQRSRGFHDSPDVAAQEYTGYVSYDRPAAFGLKATSCNSITGTFIHYSGSEIGKSQVFRLDRVGL